MGAPYFLQLSAPLLGNLTVALQMSAIVGDISPRHQPNLLSLHVMSSLYEETALYLRSIISGLVAPKLQQIWFVVTAFDNFATEWAHLLEIDRILESQAFVSLRSVTITLRYGFFNRTVDMLVENFVSHFPLLSSREMLKIEVRICRLDNYCTMLRRYFKVS
jgi:hypothetical protein